MGRSSDFGGYLILFFILSCLVMLCVVNIPNSYVLKLGQSINYLESGLLSAPLGLAATLASEAVQSLHIV